MGGVISVLRIFSKRPEQESYTFHLTMVKFLLCKNTPVISTSARLWESEPSAEAQIVENHPDGGRILSSNGRRVLDRIASQVRSKNEALVEEEEEVVEEVAVAAPVEESEA